ncbi:MAG: flagellar biosynthesis anti-sigma factor FlgM [Oligoflexales bacterium]
METKRVNQNTISPAQSRAVDSAKNADVTDSSVGGADRSKGKARDYSVELSNQSKEVAAARAKALNIAKNTPDIREDKVAEFKRLLAEGKYKVDSGKIADGILREAIRDKLALMPDE